MLSHLEYINFKMFSAYEVSLWNFSVLYDYQQSQEHPAKPLWNITTSYNSQGHPKS